ncbi:MAG: family 43 glycosylhydrolase, partial [Candidatus Limisoma sp.]
MKKLLLLFLFIGIASATALRSEIRKSQVAFADPYILLDGDYYYAYGTNHSDGIECWRSTNLVGWEYMGLALHKDNCTEKQWFWAPEVYHKNGKYYMYFSANEHLFVATSNSPTGPFYQQGGYQVQNILGSEKCIDSHVFFDDDGSAWMFFARFVPDERIYSCRLGSDLITPVSGTLRQCLQVTDSWEKIWPTVVEGLNVIKRNGIYYLTYSANSYESHDYAVGYATTTNLASGTWTKYSGNPILRRVEDMVGCGHHSLFYDKVGNLKIAYHSHYSTSSIHPRLLYFGDMYFSGNELHFNYGIQSLRPLQATEALSYVTERWNFSDLRANPTAKGYDARLVRNIAYKDGKLYCVYDHDNIKVISAETGDDLGNLKTGDICVGGTRRFCDVKVFNGHVVACNLALAGEELRIYTWDNDNAEPRLLMSTTNFYGAPRLGDCLEIAPDSNWDNNLWINFCNDDGSKTRVIEYHFDGNGWASNAWEVTTDGTNQFKTGPTARAYPDGGVWWIDGMNCKPSFFVIQNGKLVRQREIGDVSNLGSCHHEFNFRGYKYSVNHKYDGEYFGRARIQMDDAGDYSHTTWLGEYPWQGFSSTNKNDYGTGDIIVDTDGNNYVRLFVCCRGEGLACFAQGNPPVFNPTYIGGFNLQEQWNCSENAQTLFDKGYDASKIRNFSYQDGKLYCVYDNSQIKVLNAQTGEDLGNLPLGTVVAGGTLTLSDVKCFQGHVVACNLARAGEQFRLYAWDSDTQDPYLLYSTTDFQGCSSFGEAIIPAEDSFFDTSFWVNLCNDNGTASTVVELHRNSEGVWNKYHRSLTTDGTNYFNVGANARAYPNGGVWWINGNNCQPTFCSWSNGGGSPISINVTHSLGEPWGNSYHEFNFLGNRYAVVPQFENRTGDDPTTFYRNCRMRIDVANNDDHSGLLARGAYPADGLGDAQNHDCTADAMINTDGSTFVEAWVFSTNQGLAYYTWGDVPAQNPQPLPTPDPTPDPAPFDDDITAMTEVWNYSGNT